MSTYKLTLEYDGTDLSGWQIQSDRLTVQQALEDALARILPTQTRVVGSGRTDAGVHARGQVAHIVLDRPADPGRLCHSLNAVLPAGIAVLRIEEALDGFHARFDARRRLYRYQVATEARALDRRVRLLVRPVPDFGLMNEAAVHFIGTHDFNSLCRTASETENRVCTVYRAEWIPESRPGDWCFEVQADRFLHGMVRAMVGTLLQVGRGKRPADEMPNLLAARDRRVAGPAAPAHGLVLESVRYE